MHISLVLLDRVPLNHRPLEWVHDVDPGSQTHARQVLWEQGQPVVSARDAHSVSPVAGQSVVYVLLVRPVFLERALLAHPPVRVSVE
jgi:hypothetical protein